MWYELAPMMSLMFGCVMLSCNVGIFEKWFCNEGLKKPRLSSFLQDRYMFERDTIMTGSRYRVKGLENLPKVSE